MKNRMLKKLAKTVDKEDFLRQLKEQWKPYLKTNNIMEETAMAYERIRSSGMQKVFEIVGITQEDIKKIVEELVDEKESR